LFFLLSSFVCLQSQVLGFFDWFLLSVYTSIGVLYKLRKMHGGVLYHGSEARAFRREFACLTAMFFVSGVLFCYLFLFQRALWVIFLLLYNDG
jgi:hypothetical protein